jgi:hypothetical protein
MYELNEVELASVVGGDGHTFFKVKIKNDVDVKGGKNAASGINILVANNTNDLDASQANVIYQEA